MSEYKHENHSDKPGIITSIPEINADEDNAINPNSDSKIESFKQFLQIFTSQYPQMADDFKKIKLLSKVSHFINTFEFKENPISIEMFNIILINSPPIEFYFEFILEIATFICINFQKAIPILAETHFLDYIQQFFLQKHFSLIIPKTFEFLALLIHVQPDCFPFLLESGYLLEWLGIIFNFPEMGFQVPTTITETGEQITALDTNDKFNLLSHGLQFTIEAFPMFPEELKIEFLSKETSFLPLLQDFSDNIILKGQKQEDVNIIEDDDDDDFSFNMMKCEELKTNQDFFMIQMIKLFRGFCSFHPDLTAPLLLQQRQFDGLDAVPSVPLTIQPELNFQIRPVRTESIQNKGLTYRKELFLYYFIESRRYSELSDSQIDLLYIIHDILLLDFDTFYEHLLGFGLSDFILSFIIHSEISPECFIVFDVIIGILVKAPPSDAFRHNLVNSMNRILTNSETTYNVKFKIILSFAYMILGNDTDNSLFDRISREIELLPELFLVVDKANNENAMVLLNAIKKLIEHAINEGDEESIREYLLENELTLDDYEVEDEIEEIMVPLQFIRLFINGPTE